MQAVLICRQASDYLKPGYKRGFSCRSCNREVQVSAVGQPMAQDGAWVLCNPCGFRAMRFMEDREIPFDKVLSAETSRQLEQILKEAISTT